MPAKEVDIDLDDFSNYEIIREIEYRLHNKKITDSEKKKLNRILSAVGVISPTLVDKMKLEHFLKIKDNYTLEQIEEKLP